MDIRPRTLPDRRRLTRTSATPSMIAMPTKRAMSPAQSQASRDPVKIAGDSTGIGPEAPVVGAVGRLRRPGDRHEGRVGDRWWSPARAETVTEPLVLASSAGTVDDDAELVVERAGARREGSGELVGLVVATTVPPVAEASSSSASACVGVGAERDGVEGDAGRCQRRDRVGLGVGGCRRRRRRSAAGSVRVPVVAGGVGREDRRRRTARCRRLASRAADGRADAGRGRSSAGRPRSASSLKVTRPTLTSAGHGVEEGVGRGLVGVDEPSALLMEPLVSIMRIAVRSHRGLDADRGPPSDGTATPSMVAVDRRRVERRARRAGRRPRRPSVIVPVRSPTRRR